MSACPHKPYQYEPRESGWYCTECKRDVSDETGSPKAGEMGSFGIVGCGDADDIPAHLQYRHPGRKGTGSQEERREARYRDTLKEVHVNGKKVDGRIKRSIPVELYWGKIRQTGDRHYWEDKKNADRHSAWDVKR